MEKKNIGIGSIIATALFFALIFGGCETEEQKQAQFDEFLDTVESNVDAYIDEDVMLEYVGDHLDRVIEYYDLYTNEAMDNFYYEAQDAKEQAYIDGWQECCVYYGIEDEVYYTDEELAAMESEPAAQTEPEEPSEQENETVVYITPYGERYHYKASCAGKNAMETNLSDAQNSGYTPCQKCAA